jgi:hypothetical protein
MRALGRRGNPFHVVPSRRHAGDRSPGALYQLALRAGALKVGDPNNPDHGNLADPDPDQ